MVTMGIDPGTRFLGFSILTETPSILEVGVLKLSPKDHMQVRLVNIYDFIQQRIQKYGVKVIALETPYLAKNPSVYLKLGYVRATLYILAQKNGCMIREYSPTDVKKAITGHGSSKKENVAWALCKLFPLLRNQVKKGLSNDMTDALAIGVTSLWLK